ncbi:hypothetical protein BsWGS_25715 [Bradybaena similaris]
MPAKTVCVVGAGTAGIAALKECVRQGFKTTCYELDSDVGGIWRKKDYSKPTNTPAVYDGLVTNSSKFNMCYSDYPPSPEDTPYLSAENMGQYFKRAVQHFGLEKFIHFNTRVIKIRKTSDHEKTGRWEVFTANRGDGIAGSDLAGPRGDDQSLSRCKREVFDFVLVCTGYFKIPFYPDVPGMDTFKGTIQHSFSYHSSKPYDGKTVLVVGNMFSALDIANDISTISKQTYLAVGKGTWIIPRCFSNNRTLDLLFPRSVIYGDGWLMNLNNILIREAENRMDHEGIGIRPSKPPLLASWGINDELPGKLVVGKVKVYGRLTRIEGSQVQFDDGKIISGIEDIVFCTGYRPDLSFIDLDLIADNGRMELYKMMFPVHEKHNTLALIGHFGSDGPLPICFEIQARWAARVLAGKQKLPSMKKMKKDVARLNDETYLRRGAFDSYMVNAVRLMDSIAVEIGCYPSFWRILIKDPLLAYRIYYGPPYSAQYRLLGPDSQWAEAAKSCHALYEEGFKSIRYREPKALQRPDVYEAYKSRAVRTFILSTVAAVSSWLLYTFGSQIF